MKVGHSSVGYYGLVIDFLVVDNVIHIISNETGYVAFFYDKEKALKEAIEHFMYYGGCEEDDLKMMLERAIESQCEVEIS